MDTVTVSGKVTGPDDKAAGGVRVGAAGFPSKRDLLTLDGTLAANAILIRPPSVYMARMSDLTHLRSNA
jgi:hypothetical protein